MDTFDAQIGNVYNVSRAIAEQWKYIKEHAVQGNSVVNIEVVDKVVSDENFTFSLKATYSDGSSTTTPPIDIPVIKGEQGEQGIQGVQGEQGEQGIGIADVQVIPTVNDEQGMLYHFETTLTNGEVKDGGDFLVPKGDKGDQGEQGVGIQEIQGGTPTVNGEYTFTPVDVVLTNGTTQSFEVPAKNGKGGSEPMINLDLVENIDFNNFTTTQNYYITFGFSALNKPNNTSGHATIYVNRGEEFTNGSIKYCQLSQLWVGYNDNNVCEVFYRNGSIVVNNNGSSEIETGDTYWGDWTSQTDNKLYTHYITLRSEWTTNYWFYIMLTLTLPKNDPITTTQEFLDILKSLEIKPTANYNGILANGKYRFEQSNTGMSLSILSIYPYSDTQIALFGVTDSGSGTTTSKPSARYLDIINDSSTLHPRIYDVVANMNNINGDK